MLRLEHPSTLYHQESIMRCLFARLPLALLTILPCLLLQRSLTAAEDRPNVVWILSEDNSKHYLRLYGNPLGATPTIEKLAAEGLTFDHAFSCAPVCSVARTTLMTGCLAPRIGFQYHRRARLAELPHGAQLFPAYLRSAGYYTTNNSKKDYNVVEGKVWDESSRNASWRNRPTPNTPFFHMQTTTVSHESSLHFPERQMDAAALTTDPASVTLADYHPDTPTFRYTYARYYDRMQAVDQNVAAIVGRLQEDGLLDNTIVFYFGDHGGVLPRSKGYVYESGLHVPLVVYIPPKWRDVSPWQPGARVDGFVNFTDFGPTVLRLAGVEPPRTMDGRPFLGRGVTKDEISRRDETLGYADRFDEKYDVVRSLRKGRYKYIRNYHNIYPDALQNNYRYIMLAYSEWRDLYHSGKLNASQRQFFEPRPAEQLFDIENDPHEVHNLADDPAHREQLLMMRTRLQQRLKKINDLSFYPESYLVESILPDGATYGTQHSQQIADLIDTADLALLDFAAARKPLTAALESSDRWKRYWAVVACCSFGEVAKSLAEHVLALRNDDELLVRMRVAEYQAVVLEQDPRPLLAESLAATESPVAAAIMLNSAVFLKDRPDAFPLDINKVRLKVTNNEVARRQLYFAGKTKPGVNVNPRKKPKK